MFLNILLAKSDDNTTKSIEEHTKEVVMKALELCKEYNVNERLKKIIVFSALIHDAGKITYGFQSKIISKSNKDTKIIQDLKNMCINLGLNEFKGERHELYSLAFSIYFKETKDLDLVRAAVLFHHYGNKLYWDDEPVNKLEYVKSFYERGFFERYNLEKFVKYIYEKEIIKEFKKILESLGEDPSEYLDLTKKPSLDNCYNKLKINLDNLHFKTTVEVMGLLKRADHLASADIDDVFLPIHQNIKKIKISDDLELEVGKMWQSEIINKTIVENDQNTLLIAPTGSGKSEFALLYNLLKSKRKKMIFTLPLRVALNDMYNRYKKIVGNLYGKNGIDFVGLVHHTAYTEILKRDFSNNLKEYDIGKEIQKSGKFTKPFSLSTPDQCLLLSLKYFGFDELMSIMGSSFIVVDEIQAYTPEMNAIILKTLDELYKMGANILIMTATYPKYLDDLNLSFFRNKVKIKVVDSHNYLVSNKGKDFVNKVENKIRNAGIKRHLIRYIGSDIEDDLENIIYNRGKCAIIVNTVSKAVEIYDKIKTKLEERGLNNFREKLVLFHSRMLESEKEKIIKKIKKSKNDLIVVATQVIEASVDVDFDKMYTQLSPIESQIQRWGRVWRNRGIDYYLDEPNIFVYDILKEKDNTYRIYDYEMCRESKRLIENYLSGRKVGYKEEVSIVEKISEDVLNKYRSRLIESMEFLNSLGALSKSASRELFRQFIGVNVIVPKIFINRITNSDSEIIKDLWGYKNNINKIDLDDFICKLKYIIKKTKKTNEYYILKKYLLDSSIPLNPYLLYKYAKLKEEYYILDLDSEKIEKLKEYGVSEKVFENKEDFESVFI